MATDRDTLAYNPELDEAAPTSDECTLALVCHLGGFFTWIILPLIIWLIKKDDSRYVGHHGKEATNFQIMLMIYYFLLMILWGVGFAILMVATDGAEWAVPLSLLPVGLLTLVLLVYEVAFVILASFAAYNGRWYRYPGVIRVIR